MFVCFVLHGDLNWLVLCVCVCLFVFYSYVLYYVYVYDCVYLSVKEGDE